MLDILASVHIMSIRVNVMICTGCGEHYQNTVETEAGELCPYCAGILGEDGWPKQRKDLDQELDDPRRGQSGPINRKTRGTS